MPNTQIKINLEKLMPLSTMPSYHDLGAKVGPNGVYFSAFLPSLGTDISARVQVVREQDFYEPSKRKEYILAYDQTTNLWSTSVATIDFGVDADEVTFLYWFDIARGDRVSHFQVDPYAREFGLGKYSAFTINLPPKPQSIQVEDLPLEETIMYELNIMEFGGTIQGCTNRLDYLQDLGVNCVLIMPVHNVSDQVNWGYLPLGYFGIDERYGNRRDFQEFANECHVRNIRVVLDVVLAHTSGSILYHSLYRDLRIDSPLSGQGNEWGGINIDYDKPFAIHFIKDAVTSIVENFDIDGLRFDWVAGFWSQYPDIVDHAVKVFSNLGKTSPVLLAELLSDRNAPRDSLSNTQSNCCYQNGTWNECSQIARDPVIDSACNGGRLYRLGISHFASDDYAQFAHEHKYALQYIENHDHSRFVTNFYGHISNTFDYMLENADKTSQYRKDNWHRVRPYLIGMLLARGIPLLWQGQELCENYWMTEGLSDGNSISRVKVLRNIRWEYCLEEEGAETRRLVKDLIKLRLENADVFCRGDYYFYNDYELYQKRGLLLFSRRSGTRIFLVTLNFSINEVSNIPCPAPFHSVSKMGELGKAIITEGKLSLPLSQGDVLSFEQGGQP